MSKAIFKFNSGNGALLCSGCNKIIKVGYEMTEEELSGLKRQVELGAQYCDKCKDVKDEKENYNI